MMIASVSAAGEKTGPPHDKQMFLINQLRGTNMTTCEFMEIVYPEEYNVLRQRLSKDAFEEFCIQTYYWGDDYPELAYGADIWTERGPLNISALNETERERYGLRDTVIGGNGYRIMSYLKWHIRQGETKSFHRSIQSGLNNVTCDLTWLNTKSSLKLTIFTPDGMMGPYHDSSDGKENGRIFLQLFRGRNLTCGDWYVVIEAEKTAEEAQPFRLLFY
jgi:hypothetical protein